MPRYRVTRTESFEVVVDADRAELAEDMVKDMSAEEMDYIESHHVAEEITEPKHKWLWLFQCTPDGHHIYTDLLDGRYACADLSIRDRKDPSSTDDGLLYLDLSKPLTVKYMPLIKENGEPSGTTCSIGKALLLSRKLNWDIALPDGSILNVGRNNYRRKDFSNGEQ